MEIKLNNNVKEIINRLNENGFEAYVVGGAVRDYIMGRVPHDFDICTNALPNQIIEIFDDVITIGIKYGTAGVIVDNKEYEVTTYRKDGKYLNARKPESVDFVDELVEDLKRRDLTINAIAYNESDGIVDPLGGIADINSKVIKAVGNPEERFREDAIRMIRAIRFASRFDFNIENNTYNAIKQNYKLIEKVSPMRFQKELNEILVSENVADALYNLKDTKILECVIPELYNCIGLKYDNLEHSYDVFTNTIECIKRINNEDYDINLKLRLALLLQDIGMSEVNLEQEETLKLCDVSEISAKLAKGILTKFGYSINLKKDVVKLIKYHNTIPANIDECTEEYVKRQMSELKELYPLYLDVIEANVNTKSKDREENIKIVNEMRLLYEKLSNEKITLQFSDLQINGNDLIKMGFKPGKNIKNALQDLLEHSIVDESFNEKENMIAYLNTQDISKYDDLSIADKKDILDIITQNEKLYIEKEKIEFECKAQEETLNLSQKLYLGYENMNNL